MKGLIGRAARHLPPIGDAGGRRSLHQSNWLPWAAVFAIPLVVWIVSLLRDKLLSADGVYYLQRIADDQAIFFEGWHRSAAQIVTQWPAVLMARFEGASLSAIKVAYEVGLTLPFLVLIGLTIRWFAPRPTLLVLPLASVFLLNINASYIVTGEHQMLSLVAWPLLAFALFPRTGAPDRVAALLLAALSLRLYETAAIVFIPILIISAIRLLSSKNQLDKIFWEIFSLLLSAAIIIGSHGILFPRDAGNRSGFVDAVFDAMNSPLVWSLVPAILLLGLSIAFRRQWGVWLAMVWAITSVSFALAGDQVLTAWVSFNARGMTAYVLPVLLFIALGLTLLPKESHNMEKAVLLAGFTLAISAGLYHITTERLWTAHLTHYQTTLEQNSGFVDAAEVGLIDKAGWSWGHGLRSIMLAGPCVTTIVETPSGRWRPYDLSSTLVLERFRAYAETLGGEGCPGNQANRINGHR